ncbi:MAG: DUF4159 domain-containing protein [Myxococcales bacterium]|nr:DUF4159 domain-containing protein [Myxococcales bacterium]
MSGRKLERRSWLLGAATLTGASLLPREGAAFGEDGAFHARILSTGGMRLSGPRESAPGRWAWELVRRTSAPARMSAAVVAADAATLFHEPFVIWAGESEVPPLTARELRGLREYIRLGGVLVVDDARPEDGSFGRSARRELQRVLPDSSVVPLDARHVVYKSYYMIERPVGRVLGPPRLEAIIRGKDARVLFSSHDLLGALARDGSTWAFEVSPGGSVQRQNAIRLAVNLAMYVLCSDYKDDQVHAPWLMRRRARRPR